MRHLKPVRLFFSKYFPIKAFNFTMIEYIKGRIASLTPTDAVVETYGIGYFVNISLQSFAALQNAEETKIWIHEVIREDAHSLYGFTTEGEREMFRSLIAVSGVGANTARMILSALSADQLASVITSGDVRTLKSIKGIGGKTAERIIVDLRDKIKQPDDSLSIQTALRSDIYEEALAALLMLGFPKPQSQKVIGKIFDSEPSISVESAIKKALTML